MPALADYPYLGFALFLFCIAIVVGAIVPTLRRGMLLAGVGCIPGALLTVSFVPSYWNPMRLGGGWIGVEDVIFSFSTGSLMWFTLFGPNGSTGVIPKISAGSVLRRYFSCGPLFVLLYWGLRRSAYEPMDAAIGAMIILGAGIAFLVPQLVPLAMRGAAVFCLLYAAVLAIAFQLWPAFLEQWSTATISGHRLGLIPSEELAWAFVTACTYPLVMAFVVGTPSRTIAAEPFRRFVSR